MTPYERLIENMEMLADRIEEERDSMTEEDRREIADALCQIRAVIEREMERRRRGRA